ncbi:MAG TPA: TatD family deoxyribonuclease, partial [bacterium]|nr:TatD family deoxyribonuclease [bacterium]
RVLDRARKAGVAAVFTVSETLADAEKNLKLAETHSMLKPLAGLYPGRIGDEAVEPVIELIRTNRKVLIGIGEVGLDFWKAGGEEERDRQRAVFGRFIDLALELDRPLNVHSRSAGRHAIAMLLEKGAARVQLHAFDGKASTALPAVEAGYFFSVPPSIVRSAQKQKLIKRLPLSCLLLETDSPVLGADPGIRNEPSAALQAAKAVSEIKDIQLQEVLEAALDNTRRLYGASVQGT